MTLRSLIFSCVLFMTACGARERFDEGEEDHTEIDLGAAPGRSAYVARFDLSGGAPEEAASRLFSLPAARTYVGLVRVLERLVDDEDAKAVFVRIDQAQFDWPQSEELGNLLARLRRANKPVVCHAHTLSNNTMLLLSKACSRIWLSPAGEVNTVGIAAQMAYIKGALDKLKVRADFLSMGRFKSGGEPVTRTGPSEPSRENLTEALRSIRQTWLEGAEQARKKPGLRKALERGPYVPEEAKKLGLVDEVGFESEALRDVKKSSGNARIKSVFGPGAESTGSGLTEIVRILAGATERDSGRAHIAVVPAVGGITMQAGGGFASEGITERAMGKVLRRLRKDEAVKAVVVRLDSPGGSPLASDLIWHEMMRLKEKKPVVVSVGGMAASGGYYIACAADRIVAERTSIVGSIGVFGGKFIVGEALEQFGITSYTFPASSEPGAEARAAYMSPLTAWDDATRAKVSAHMRHIYDLFLRRVAKGRHLPLDQVKKSAEGAIFTARQGKERKLVDDLGGLAKALQIARQRAKLDSDIPVIVQGLRESLIESLFVSDEPSAGEVQAAVARLEAQREAWQRLFPAEMHPFLSSLMPLAQGEHTLAALPFVLVVR